MQEYNKLFKYVYIHLICSELSSWSSKYNNFGCCYSFYGYFIFVSRIKVKAYESHTALNIFEVQKKRLFPHHFCYMLHQILKQVVVLYRIMLAHFLHDNNKK